MVNEEMRKLGAYRSTIRELFEYANGRRAAIGKENVFDFSLGNPMVEPPYEVKKTLSELLEKPSIHAYTSAQGDAGVRKSIADYIKAQFGFDADSSLIYLTVGAAAALVATLSAILNAGDEVIVPAPFFPEYRVFLEQTGATLVPVLCEKETFGLDVPAIECAITKNTKAILVNSPNNPTGAVYSEQSLRRLAEVLTRKSKEMGHPIYLVADEPYRELVYDGVDVPYLPNLYDNSVVCYSFSKSLSLPGERIGYVLVSPRCEERQSLYEAVCGAGRVHGYVCAPSIFQYMIPHCLGTASDISVYDRNRRTLLSHLRKEGFRVVEPQGAFYLFAEAWGGDATAFAELAKKQEIILVPADAFGCKGYVRIAYCVSEDTVRRSLPAFSRLAEECRKSL